jgi:hypothetical protein
MRGGENVRAGGLGRVAIRFSRSVRRSSRGGGGADAPRGRPRRGSIARATRTAPRTWHPAPTAPEVTTMTLHPARARSAHVSASAPRRLRWRWPLRNRLDVPTLITTTLCFLGALPTRISPGLTPIGLLTFILECIVREADATTRDCDCGAERAGFSLRLRWPSIFPPGRAVASRARAGVGNPASTRTLQLAD